MRTSMRRTIELLACGLAVLSGSPAAGSLDQQFFVSNNNKLYYVVKSDAGSGIGTQVTSIMMTNGTALNVNETSNPADPVLTSMATKLSGTVFGSIKRTPLLTGFASNDVVANDGSLANGSFDPSANNGDGLLTLPGGTRTVAFDGSGTEPVQDITGSSGAGVTFVPAAVTTTVTRRVGLTFSNAQTIVFPNPAGPVVTSNGATCSGGGCGAGIVCDPANDGGADTAACGGCGGTCGNFGGEVSTQNVSLDETRDSRVGNDAGGAAQQNAVDGFLLKHNTDIIVFMVDGAGQQAFGLSSSGFSVNAETLSQRTVLDSTGDADNSNFRSEQERPPPPPPLKCAPVASEQGLMLLALALIAGGAHRLRRRASS